MSEKLAQLKQKGGGDKIKADGTTAITVSGGAAPSYTTKGEAIAIYLVYMPTVYSGQVYIITNVNPSTGEVDNNHLYTCNNNSTYVAMTGYKFIVTSNSVTLSSSLSSSSIRTFMSYTYK